MAPRAAPRVGVPRERKPVAQHRVVVDDERRRAQVGRVDVVSGWCACACAPTTTATTTRTTTTAGGGGAPQQDCDGSPRRRGAVRSRVVRHDAASPDAADAKPRSPASKRCFVVEWGRGGRGCRGIGPDERAGVCSSPAVGLLAHVVVGCGSMARDAERSGESVGGWGVLGTEEARRVVGEGIRRQRWRRQRRRSSGRGGHWVGADGGVGFRRARGGTGASVDEAAGQGADSDADADATAAAR